MTKPKKDKGREERITMDIIVDANGPEKKKVKSLLDSFLKIHPQAWPWALREFDCVRKGDISNNSIEILNLTIESQQIIFADKGGMTGR